MENKILIDAALPQWKGNLHMHTSRSPDSPTDYHDALDEYKSRGFQFCLMSDHEAYWDSDEMNSDDFIVLSGVESAFYRNQTRPYMLSGQDLTSMHLNLIRHPDLKAEIPSFAHDEIIPRPNDYGLDSWNEAIRHYKQMGHIVVLNHPSWSRLTPEMMLGIQGCFAFEVINTGCVQEVGCPTDKFYWDFCLQRGKRIFASAGDDTHFYGDNYATCGGSWNMVSAPKLDAGAIVRGLESGSFYPSTGPIIHGMRIENGMLFMRFSPARSLRVVSWPGFGTAKTLRPGHTFTAFEWPVKESLRYFRVEVVDENGGVAWSQPVFLEDLLKEPRYIHNHR